MTAVPLVTGLMLWVVTDGSEVGNGTVVSPPPLCNPVFTVPTVEGCTDVEAVWETGILKLTVVVVTVGTGMLREMVKVQKCECLRASAAMSATVGDTRLESAARAAKAEVSDVEIVMAADKWRNGLTIVKQ